MSIRSTWGETLVDEIHRATPSELLLWYLGGNGFVLKNATDDVVLIDPYLGRGNIGPDASPQLQRMIPIPFQPEDVRTATGILVTHEHQDHLHGPSQAPILASTEASLLGPRGCIEQARDDEDWCGRWDIDESALSAVEANESVDVGTFSVTPVPINDPSADHTFGYVIEHGGTTIFHGGDGFPGQELEKIGSTYDIDVAILAFGSAGVLEYPKRTERAKLYMDENEVIEATAQLQANTLLPSHFDLWRGFTADPTVLHHHAASSAYPIQIEICYIGDSREVRPCQ